MFRSLIGKMAIMLIAFCIIVITGLVILSSEIQRESFDVVSELNKLGYTTRYEVLESRIPNLTDDENFASAYRKAFAELTDQGEDPAEHFPMFGLGDDEGDWDHFDPEDVETTREFLAKNTKAIELLQEASEIKQGAFITDYSQGYYGLTPHLEKLRASIRVVCLQAEYFASTDNMEEAAKAILLALNENNSARESFVRGMEGEMVMGEIMFSALAGGATNFDVANYYSEISGSDKYTTLAEVWSLPFGKT